jgi:ribosomal protein S12 methylthiotransferase
VTADLAAPTRPQRVAVLTLGCARNEVDSEELAGRLADGGFDLVDENDAPDAVLVNTCAFVESARKDSVDALLGVAGDTPGTGPAVIAVGCMAERYGRELAEALPEARAVLGFDDYPDIASRLRGILGGAEHRAHIPRDRRTLLPVSPVQRPAAAATVVVPGMGQTAPGASLPPLELLAGAPASGPRPVRRRLSGGPLASVKLASGCDRRCAFCAIPAFRGSFVSRPPAEVLAEVAWLAADGVREVFLVSENTTSYGKDLGDLRALESLLPQIAAVPGIERVRVSYLQPAEMRPGLAEVICGTPGVVPYFDLSFQHASGPLLRRMRRFGDGPAFLDLLAGVRRLAPEAGVRSNVIVGFPGETEDDLAALADFLTAARLDVVGVFGYSDEEGTEAAGLPGHLPQDEIDARVSQLSSLVDELVAQRAEDRIGEMVTVLVEDVSDPSAPVGRAAHQGPEVDGTTTLVGLSAAAVDGRPGVRVGEFVRARVTDTDGVDLFAEPDRSLLDG